MYCHAASTVTQAVGTPDSFAWAGGIPGLALLWCCLRESAGPSGFRELFRGGESALFWRLAQTHLFGGPVEFIGVEAGKTSERRRAVDLLSPQVPLCTAPPPQAWRSLFQISGQNPQWKLARNGPRTDDVHENSAGRGLACHQLVKEPRELFSDE